MYSVSAEDKKKSAITKEEWKEYTKTVWSIANISHEEHPAVFPEEIPLRLIKLFSFYGETVLDPFGGTGTTSYVASTLGRNSIYVDQSKQYMKIAKERCSVLQVENTRMDFIHGDAKELIDIPESSISLIVTSPPYWDKADYGKAKINIGNKNSYVGFLEQMKQAFKEFYRVLEPGRKLCINTANVNQYTEHGLLTFPIAADYCILLRDLGFVMINEIIWSKDKTGGRWGSANGQRPIFGSYPYPPNFLFKNVHEYIIIFAKPDTEIKKGPKVRLMAEVMGKNS